MQNKKVVYLTYDDGPNKGFVEKIDYLNSKEIKAMWFCQGCRLEENLEDAIYAIKSGHIIANHSYDHPHFSELTMEQAREQIQSTEMLIEKAYEQAGTKQPFKCFRFPYLDMGAGSDTFPPDMKDKKTIMYQQLLKDMGYVYPNFDGITYEWYRVLGFEDTVSVEGCLDTDDWRINEEADDIEAVYQEVLAGFDKVNPDFGFGLNTAGSNELVVLHEFVAFKYFTGIVEKLVEKGVTFSLPHFR